MIILQKKNPTIFPYSASQIRCTFQDTGVAWSGSVSPFYITYVDVHNGCSIIEMSFYFSKLNAIWAIFHQQLTRKKSKYHQNLQAYVSFHSHCSNITFKTSVQEKTVSYPVKYLEVGHHLKLLKMNNRVIWVSFSIKHPKLRNTSKVLAHYVQLFKHT